MFLNLYPNKILLPIDLVVGQILREQAPKIFAT